MRKKSPKPGLRQYLPRAEQISLRCKMEALWLEALQEAEALSCYEQEGIIQAALALSSL